MMDKKGIKYLVPSFVAVTAVVTGLNGGLSSAKALVPDFSPAYAAEATKTAGKATKTKKADNSSSKTTTPYKASGDLSRCADGTYYGNGRGYAGNIKVKVVIKDHEMKSIDIVEVEADDAPYVAKAKGVISVMLKKQSLNVDTVSGATYSSNGIIKAVEDALAQAAGKASSGHSKSSEGGKSKEDSPSVNHDDSLDGQVFRDGVYNGTAEGYNGDLTVAVTIKKGKITKIVITETEDDKAYLDKAKAVIKRIISTQSTKVDTVSGATFSSVGIIGAVEDALKKAVKTATDSDAEPDKEDPNKDKEEDSSNEGSTDLEEPGKAEEGVIYKNGTYTGTAVCTDDDEFWYDITVQISVAGDKVTAVSVMDNSADTSDGGWAENVKYINWVINGRMGKNGVPTQIVRNGLPEGIDTIAGATYSSNAVVCACQAALEKAKIQ